MKRCCILFSLMFISPLMIDARSHKPNVAEKIKEMVEQKAADAAKKIASPTASQPTATDTTGESDSTSLPASATIATGTSGASAKPAGLPTPTTGTIAALAATVPTQVSAIETYRKQRAQQADYFFSTLPKTSLPDLITAELRMAFKPLVTLLPTLDSSQPASVRHEKVMQHIILCYQLLYLVAQAETAQKNSSGTTPQTAPTLTAKDLANSPFWFNFLKLKVADSYDQELLLLGQLHNHQQMMLFSLPYFEISYYQDTSLQTRLTGELTRLYLMLSDQVRERQLAAIGKEALANSWTTVLNQLSGIRGKGTAGGPSLATLNSQLFGVIENFKQSPFYIGVHQFEAIDWSKTYPLTLVDPQNKPMTLQDAAKNNCDFSHYFSYNNTTGALEVTPGFVLMFGYETKEGQPEVFMTALGNLLFTGSITYDTIKDSDENPLHRATFVKRTQSLGKNGVPTGVTFDQLFTTDTQTVTANKQTITQPTISPTVGYMEVLCATAFKLLYDDVGELFTGPQLAAALKALILTDLPSFIPHQSADYALLREINTLQQKIIEPPTGSRDKQTPQQEKDTYSLQKSHHHCESAAHWFARMGREIKHQWHRTQRAFKKFGRSIARAFKRFGYSIENSFKKLGRDFVRLGKHIYGALKAVARAAWHALKAIGNEVVALYYGSCIGPMICQGMSASKALRHAATYQKKVSHEIDACTKDLEKAVTLTADAFDDLVHAVVTGFDIINPLAELARFIDPKLISDFEGMVTSVTDAAVEIAKDGINLVVEGVGDVVKLTADAVELIQSGIGAVVSGGLFTKAGAEAFGDEIVSMAKDTASSILSAVSIVANGFTKVMQDAMLAVGYFVQTLTDAVIDACVIIAFGQGNVRAQLEAHSRIISSLITTVVLVAVTILTGGAATPFAAGMLAMNVGMMAMSVAGSAQSDQAAIDQKSKQEKFVTNYKQYVIDNAAAIEAFNTRKAIEEMVQLQTELNNQERALVYYQNYLNSQFNSAVSSQGFVLGSAIRQKGSPRVVVQSDGTRANTGIAQGDLGSLYGVQTGRLNLWPVNGFSLYNTGRCTFSQEAAVAPLAIPDQLPSAQLGNQDTMRTFWFEQKDLAMIPAGKPLEADVMWRSLYEDEDQFYIGVYLTERAVDLTAVTNAYNKLSTATAAKSGTTTSSADFDTAWEEVDAIGRYLGNFDHLAKMFVCYRSAQSTLPANATPASSASSTTAPQLGIYVHEATTTGKTGANTNGWLTSPLAPINFKRGTWYRMQAALQGKTLTVKFWEVGDDKAAQATTTETTPPSTAITATATVDTASTDPVVAALGSASSFGGSMGVISSGASVEYIVLAPQEVVTYDPQKNAPLKINPLKPGFSGARIIANNDLAKAGLDKSEAAREKAWYKSLSSQSSPQFGNLRLTAINEQAITQSIFIYQMASLSAPDVLDFVVFVQGTGQTPPPSSFAVNPTANPAPTIIVSLVSGFAYDNTGALIGRIANPLDLYNQGHPQLSTAINTQIKNAQKTFWQTKTGPFAFQNLKITGQADQMANGAFVYAGPSLDPLLTGKQDYYVCATTNGSGITQTGMPLELGTLSAGITALISLTTGKVYYINTSGKFPTQLLSTTLGQMSIVDGQTVFDVYADYKSKLTDSVRNILEAARASYQQSAQTMSADQQLMQLAQSTANALNSSLSALANQLVFASAQMKQTLTTAQTTGTTQQQALQTALNGFKAALAKGAVASTSSDYTGLQAAIAAAQAAQKAVDAATQQAATALAAAPVSSSDSSYGYSSSSGYGSSSSYDAYNSYYGNYGGGYGSSGGY